MRRLFVRINLLTVFVLAEGVVAQPTGRPGVEDITLTAGQSCPAGTTEIRPRICRAPEAAAPSILDYRPLSTLVTPSHLVRAAKYPAIDYHGHPQDLINSAEGLARLGTALDSLNVRLMVAADNLSGERLQRASTTQIERWLELSLFPGRRYPQDQFPSFDELMTERDNLFRKHPKTTFVAAYMGWRVFETRDEYFDYYRHYHAFWKLYGIDLPDSVLKKVYYENALKITRGLPRS